MTILESALIGVIAIIIIGFLGPKIVRKLSKHKQPFPTSESYHVVELHKDKDNPFWFRIFLSRKIIKDGVGRIELSKRKTYIMVLIKPDGQYEHILMVKGNRQPIPKGRDSWRAYLTGLGYPEKGYPDQQILDGFYTHQPRLRRQKQRPGFPQP